jgi:hypothetical protein
MKLLRICIVAAFLVGQTPALALCDSSSGTGPTEEEGLNRHDSAADYPEETNKLPAPGYSKELKKKDPSVGYDEELDEQESAVENEEGLND